MLHILCVCGVSSSDVGLYPLMDVYDHTFHRLPIHCSGRVNFLQYVEPSTVLYYTATTFSFDLFPFFHQFFLKKLDVIINILSYAFYVPGMWFFVVLL